MMWREFLGLLVLVLVGALLPITVGAEAAPQLCVEGSAAAAERVIEDCDAILADKATANADATGIYLARAEALARQGRLRLAIDDLGKVIERRSGEARAFYRRAELHRTLGDADAAIRDFGTVIRLEPGNAAALLARGELYRARIDRRRALADYAAALRLEPSNEAANAGHKALAQEIERLGATMPLLPLQR